MKGHKMELKALGTQRCVFMSLFLVCLCVVDFKALQPNPSVAEAKHEFTHE